MLFLVICLAFFLSFREGAADDPEAYMTPIELIGRWGYPAEMHEVITPDGYILSLFRIPQGRSSQANSSCTRPAILLVHGLSAGPTEFLMNPPESCPAFILADAGFDVFLLNHRGTTYSKRHITLAPWDNKYWQFTIDELVKYDATAVIDKVLQLTVQNGLYWVGHSQGTTTGFMLLADHPEYNSKVKALFQLGPPGTAGRVQGVLWVGNTLYNTFKPLFDFYRLVLGSHEYAWQWSFLYRPLVRLCEIIQYVGPVICDQAPHLMFGPSTRTLNISRTPVYLSHTPSGTSTWNMLHWGQMAARLKFEHMDHNPLENIQRYGQATPPLYNLSNVDVPVYIFWGTSDWLTTGYDAENLINNILRKGIAKGIPIDGYNHIDFMVATDCAHEVYNPIAEIVRSREGEMCTS